MLRVLETAATEARGIQDKAAIATGLIDMMHDFIRNFGDESHHAKEGMNLFPMLEKKIMSHDTGPIAVMLAEHIEGKRKLSNIEGLVAEVNETSQSTKTLAFNPLSMRTFIFFSE